MDDMALDFKEEFNKLWWLKKQCYSMSKGIICLELKHNILTPAVDHHDQTPTYKVVKIITNC